MPMMTWMAMRHVEFPEWFIYAEIVFAIACIVALIVIAIKYR